MSPLCCGNNTGQCRQSSKRKETYRRCPTTMNSTPESWSPTSLITGNGTSTFSKDKDFFENVKHELQLISFTTGEIILILLACLLGLSVAALCTSLSECAKQKRLRWNPLPAFKKRKYDFIVVQGRVEEKLVIEEEGEDQGEVENEVDF